MKFYYKYTNKILPDSLNYLDFTPISDTHTHDTRGKIDLVTPRVKSNLSLSSLIYKIPNHVNLSIPEIRNKVSTHSYQGYSKYIKTLCLQNYPNTCLIANCYVCNIS